MLRRIREFADFMKSAEKLLFHEICNAIDEYVKSA